MTNDNSETLRELIAKLPEGQIRLIDDRIVADSSLWAIRNHTVLGILHRKKSKPEQLESIRLLIDIANAARKEQGVPVQSS